MFNFVLRYFPRQFDFISTQVDAFRQQRIQLGLAASLLMIWSSLGVFGAITTAVNYAWKVDRQPNYFKHKLVAFLMLAASSVLLLVALVLISAGIADRGTAGSPTRWGRCRRSTGCAACGRAGRARCCSSW